MYKTKILQSVVGQHVLIKIPAVAVHKELMGGLTHLR